MTRTTAREAGLDLYCFPKAALALTYAMERKHFTLGGPRVVAVFEEVLAGFPCFFIAVWPCPPITPFHERIAP